MFESSQPTMIGTEEEKQHAIQEDISPANPNDTAGEVLSDRTQENGLAREPANQGNPFVQEDVPQGSGKPMVSPSETFNQHAEAGRKGAHRIHQLIEQGKLYEREHGLKPGRQRLRQLIQEGKVYEQEHGLNVGSKSARKVRRPRISHEQLFKTFLQSLLRLAKPTYRARILDLLQALEGESK